MPVNGVAEQVFGTMGTVCWTGQILPQIWKSWREKSTEGLSPWLVLIWGISGVFLGVFVIVQDLNIPLIVQPQVFGFLSIASWSQCLYYGYGMSLLQVSLVIFPVLSTMGGFEAGMVFAVRPAVDGGNQGPVLFFGIMTSVLLAAGLLPQYWEIIRFQEVKGISLFFMAIDTLGGVFSLLSLVFREEFDVLAGVAYSLVIVLDSVVIILALILNPRAERRRRQLARENEEHGSRLATTISDAGPGCGEGQTRVEQMFADSGARSRRQSQAISRETSSASTEKQQDSRGVVAVNAVSDLEKG